MDNKLTTVSKKKIIKEKITSKHVFVRTFSNQIIVASFFLIILIGSLLLSMDAALKMPIDFFSAVFTATSATCVTGMSIVNPMIFSDWGHFIILILIQIGGLGFMTLSFFLMSIINKDLGMNNAIIVKDSLNLTSNNRIQVYLKFIIKMTFFLEFVGSTILFLRLVKLYPIKQALFAAIFHAVSAFCNAGCSPYPQGLSFFQNDSISMITIQALSLTGSLGFLVIFEFLKIIKHFFQNLFSEYHQKVKRTATSLHFRIIAKTSIILIVLGTCSFFAIERNLLLANVSVWKGLKITLFHTIMLRSTGFSIFPIAKLSNASLFLSILYMIIGASPGSTGGGIKTTTFTVFLATIYSIIRGKAFVEISGRTISEQQVYKAVSIVSIFLLWIFCSTFLLLLFEQNFAFFDLFFETCGSLSNVGFSTGITTKLSKASQIVLLINMLAGRIGLLTFIFGIRQNYEKQKYKFPKEEIILG